MVLRGGIEPPTGCLSNVIVLLCQLRYCLEYTNTIFISELRYPPSTLYAFHKFLCVSSVFLLVVYL